MRTSRKIRYRLEWLGLKAAAKFLPLLSRNACYRLALLLGSLGAMLDRRGRRVALSNLRVACGDEFFWSPRRTRFHVALCRPGEQRLGRHIAEQSQRQFASTRPSGAG